MDIRWRNYSHSLVIKIIVFIVGILCFTNAITILADIAVIKDLNMDIAFEKSYFQGADFLNDSRDIVWNLRDITEKYQSEEHVLKGDTLSEAELRDREEPLFGDFRIHSKYYHPNLSDQENHTTFKEVYADKIAQLRDQLIKQELQHYNAALQKLKSYPGLIYYAKDGDTELTNSPNKTKDYFKSFPTYMIFDGAEETVSPAEIKESPHYSWINSNNQLGSQSIVYIAFTKDFSNPREEAWANNIIVVDNGLYQIAAFLLGWAVAAIYLLLVIGRNSNKVQEVQFNFIDRIYNDFKLVLCFVLMGLWVAAISWVNHYKIHEMIFPITFLVATLGSILVLSFVKHLKNKTLIKQTIVYALFHKLYKFIKDIYDSGSVGVKVAIIVIGYPALVALTFFMFPITIGAAAWIALKKVKEFNVLKEGVQKVKEGDIHYTIDVPGDGEFGKLAADINSITDGLSNAVQNELKSERLKTELITNVSHDIRTPLTSIITYVDLLKKEKDPEKAEEYLEIIDQKSQRLK
ncbi:MAG: histidine kinase dimerization/phospho-acceptor domain-containing protein, partial [Bacillota bacterium]|nr:histidine kinase dimerization/phospho-acceptor domain-containing protein [Bacillota bacterium]